MALYFCEVSLLERKREAGARAAGRRRRKPSHTASRGNPPLSNSTPEFSGRFGRSGSPRTTSPNLSFGLRGVSHDSGPCCRRISHSIFFFSLTWKTSQDLTLFLYLTPPPLSPRPLCARSTTFVFFSFSLFDAFNIFMIKLGGELFFSGREGKSPSSDSSGLPFLHPNIVTWTKSPGPALRLPAPGGTTAWGHLYPFPFPNARLWGQ